MHQNNTVGWNPANQLRLLVYPILLQGFTHPFGGDRRISAINSISCQQQPVMVEVAISKMPTPCLSPQHLKLPIKIHSLGIQTPHRNWEWYVSWNLNTMHFGSVIGHPNHHLRIWRLIPWDCWVRNLLKGKKKTCSHIPCLSQGGRNPPQNGDDVIQCHVISKYIQINVI